MVVLKAGGTSMATAASIRKVEEILRQNSDRKIIVVSAPGKWAGDPKITWLLTQAVSRPAQSGAFLSAVRTRYAALAKALDVEWDMDALWQDFVFGQGEQALVALGEHLAAHLVSRAWGIPFLDAREGIVFEGDSVDIPATYLALRKVVGDNSCGVMGGFFGCDRGGRVRLLPYGGSDVTGALLAAALDADLYQNWTDVDGVYSDDPNRYPLSRPIAHLSYRQIYAMSYWGAKVLHPLAVKPCADKGIPIRIRNTFDPKGQGTLIDDEDQQGAIGYAGGLGYVLVTASRYVSLPYAVDSVKTDEGGWWLVFASDAYRTVRALEGGKTTVQTVGVVVAVGTTPSSCPVRPLWTRYRWRGVATLLVFPPSQYERAREGIAN